MCWNFVWLEWSSVSFWPVFLIPLGPWSCWKQFAEVAPPGAPFCETQKHEDTGHKPAISQNDLYMKICFKCLLDTGGQVVPCWTLTFCKQCFGTSCFQGASVEMHSLTGFRWEPVHSYLSLHWPNVAPERWEPCAKNRQRAQMVCSAPDGMIYQTAQKYGHTTYTTMLSLGIAEKILSYFIHFRGQVFSDCFKRKEMIRSLDQHISSSNCLWRFKIGDTLCYLSWSRQLSHVALHKDHQNPGKKDHISSSDQPLITNPKPSPSQSNQKIAGETRLFHGPKIRHLGNGAMPWFRQPQLNLGHSRTGSQWISNSDRVRSFFIWFHMAFPGFSDFKLNIQSIKSS